MSIFSKLLGTDKAIEGISKVAEKGMEIWDMKDFTPQERVAAFERLAKVMGSKETALSRRILLWAILALNGLAFTVGMIWVAYEDAARVTAMIELVEAFKLGWAFVAAVGFYFLTHVTGAGKK